MAQLSLSGGDGQEVDQSVIWLMPAACASHTATVVSVAFQAVGQLQLAPWHNAVLEAFPEAAAARTTGRNASGVQLLNLVYLQGWFFKALSGMLTRTTQRALDPRLQHCTGIVFEPSAKVADVSAPRTAA